MLFVWWLSFTYTTFMRNVKRVVICCSCEEPRLYDWALENIPGQGSCVSPFSILLANAWCSRGCLPRWLGFLCVDPFSAPSPQCLLKYTLLLLLLVFPRNSGPYKLRGHLSTRRFMSPVMEGVSRCMKGCRGLWIRAQSCGCTKYVAEILWTFHFVFWMLPSFLPKSVKFSTCQSVFWAWIAFFLCFFLLTLTSNGESSHVLEECDPVKERNLFCAAVKEIKIEA